MTKTRLQIKEVAIKKGFDAAKLARRADMSYGTIWSLWHDPYRLNIPVKTLVRIAEVLGVEISQLISDDSFNDTLQNQNPQPVQDENTDNEKA